MKGTLGALRVTYNNFSFCPYKKKVLVYQNITFSAIIIKATYCCLLNGRRQRIHVIRALLDLSDKSLKSKLKTAFFRLDVDTCTQVVETAFFSIHCRIEIVACIQHKNLF